MEISKKILHLNYEEEKEGKTLHRSISFIINKAIDDALAKEVGESIATLIKKDIEKYTVSITELL